MTIGVQACACSVRAPTCKRAPRGSARLAWGLGCTPKTTLLNRLLQVSILGHTHTQRTPRLRATTLASRPRAFETAHTHSHAHHTLSHTDSHIHACTYPQIHILAGTRAHNNTHTYHTHAKNTYSYMHAVTHTHNRTHVYIHTYTCLRTRMSWQMCRYRFAECQCYIATQCF